MYARLHSVFRNIKKSFIHVQRSWYDMSGSFTSLKTTSSDGMHILCACNNTVWSLVLQTIKDRHPHRIMVSGRGIWKFDSQISALYWRHSKRTFLVWYMDQWTCQDSLLSRDDGMYNWNEPKEVEKSLSSKHIYEPYACLLHWHAVQFDDQTLSA